MRESLNNWFFEKKWYTESEFLEARRSYKENNVSLLADAFFHRNDIVLEEAAEVSGGIEWRNMLRYPLYGPHFSALVGEEKITPFPSSDPVGVFVQLFLNGERIYVFVDGWLPFRKKDLLPLFMKPWGYKTKNQPNFRQCMEWGPCYVEKAIAKLYGIESQTWSKVFPSQYWEHVLGGLIAETTALIENYRISWILKKSGVVCLQLEEQIFVLDGTMIVRSKEDQTTSTLYWVDSVLSPSTFSDRFARDWSGWESYEIEEAFYSEFTSDSTAAGIPAPGRWVESSEIRELTTVISCFSWVGEEWQHGEKPIQIQPKKESTETITNVYIPSEGGYVFYARSQNMLNADVSEQGSFEAYIFAPEEVVGSVDRLIFGCFSPHKRWVGVSFLQPGIYEFVLKMSNPTTAPPFLLSVKKDKQELDLSDGRMYPLLFSK